MDHRPRLDEITDEGAPLKRHAPRRFSIIGIAIRILLAVVIIAGAAVMAQRMVTSQPEPVRRGAFERSFTVSVADAVPSDFTANLHSFGEVIAATTLNLRSNVAGAIVAVSPNLRPGGRVEQGELLVQVDKFDYELALSNAENDLADAKLSLSDTQQQQDNLRLNVEFATQQYQVAVTDLERARALVESGSITTQEIGTRETVVSQREQSLRQAESTLSLQDAALERGQAVIARASRAVELAQRTLAATAVYAPFDGIVVTANAVLGAAIGGNEELATIYDSNALEVRFSLSERDYGLLVGGGMVGRDVGVTWDIDPTPLELSGKISRIGAQIDPTLGGVELYASLDGAAEADIRPGTFVSVELAGVTYPNTYRLPETAIYENTHFYVIEQSRMNRVDATIKARDGANVIVEADLPESARIITSRLAQAGDGVKVSVEGEEAETPGPGGGGFGGRPGGGGPPGGGGGARIGG